MGAPSASGNKATSSVGDLELTYRLGDRGTEAVVIRTPIARYAEVRAKLEEAFGPPVQSVPGPGRVVLRANANWVEVEWLRGVAAP